MTSGLIAVATVLFVLGTSAWIYVPLLQRETSMTRRRDLFLAGEGGEELKDEIFKRLFQRAMHINLAWLGVLFLALLLVWTMAFEYEVAPKGFFNGLLVGALMALLMLLGFWQMLFRFAARALRANREIPSAIGALAVVCALPWAVLSMVVAAMSVGVGTLLMEIASDAPVKVQGLLHALLAAPFVWAGLELLFPYRAWKALKGAFTYREESEVPG